MDPTYPAVEVVSRLREDLNRRPADYELSQEPSESTQEDPLAPEINDLDDP